MTLPEYIIDHTYRGACQCGRCIDSALDDRLEPAGHTADLIFFKVCTINSPQKDTLIALIKEHEGEFCDLDLLDSCIHNYIDLGAWIGSQELALRLMGLGSLLGVWTLLSPRGMGVISDELATKLAQIGYLCIHARPSAESFSKPPFLQPN
jgi:hypothetical protein